MRIKIIVKYLRRLKKKKIQFIDNECSYSLAESYADALRRVHTEQCRATYVHMKDALEVAHFLSTTDILETMMLF